MRTISLAALQLDGRLYSVPSWTRMRGIELDWMIENVAGLLHKECIVMAYIVMAYIVMWQASYTRNVLLGKSCAIGRATPDDQDSIVRTCSPSIHGLPSPAQTITPPQPCPDYNASLALPRL